MFLVVGIVDGFGGGGEEEAFCFEGVELAVCGLSGGVERAGWGGHGGLGDMDGCEVGYWR